MQSVNYITVSRPGASRL